MDCFVAIAPRNDGVRFRIHISSSERMCVRDPAARCARVLLEIPALEKKRAQGRPGARCTRGLACGLHKTKCTRAYRFSGNTPAFPAQWLYGLYRALRRTALLPPSLRKNGLRNLTPAPRRQDHTTSPYAFVTIVRHNISVHRNPPNVRDDGQRPSEQDGMTKDVPLICPAGKVKYF